MTRLILKILINLRWAYFHVNPAYKKFYMDSARTEAHFLHERTNSIHSNYSLVAASSAQSMNQETPDRKEGE